MENTSEQKEDKMTKKQSEHICLGILAHVDAGKTTLAESILYTCGMIRNLGRVDHGNAFLDTEALERSRGITIFSRQAQVRLGDKQITLLDTPGHVDFSAEMERTLQVLDYAILVISGADGVQGHVQTLWRLLKQYEIPVFLFINKMDQPGTDRRVRMEELQKRLDERCIDFSADQKEEAFLENLALCDENLMESYLENGSIGKEEIRDLILERKVFPCFFGSALKMQGVEHFLEGLSAYIKKEKTYPETFGARVFKIGRDRQGTRLTYLKVTGGTLKVKMPVTDQKGIWEEKIDQIRIYSGTGYETVSEATPGTICAVTGLSQTKAGEGLGIETEGTTPVLEPVLTYRIMLPEGAEVYTTLGKLRQLEEEVPEMHIVWKEEAGEIHAQVMGEVQIEILKSMIQERFGLAVEFSAGNIVYKETIAQPVEGVGHYEPLRHYAEVHLILEPLERGAGLEYLSECSEDVLDRNWQHLVLTHLAERAHKGVLTGSEVTDMRITLTAGKAHQKHTEGGDFRQATYRAIRQGLRKAESILLEPVYEYRLEVPTAMVGRALTDLQRMHAEFSPPVQEGETAVITGTAPVATMRDYPMEVTSYSKGMGRLACTFQGYLPCHNADEVREAFGYEPEADTDHPTGSIFCSHGAGYYVSWDQVEAQMHLECTLEQWKQRHSLQEDCANVKDSIDRIGGSGDRVGGISSHGAGYSLGWDDDKELQAIFERTYGVTGKERKTFRNQVRVEFSNTGRKKPKEEVPEYLLVDGYNIIFAWDDLKELSQVNIEAARNKLMDIMCNYQGYRKQTVILVFDAYKVPGNPGEVQKYHNIHVVYTKEAETADQYIEKTVHEIGRKHQVTVATSDGLEQLIIMGQGARRLSAAGLLEEVRLVEAEIRSDYLNQQPKKKRYLFEELDEKTAELMHDIRMGKAALHEEETRK